MFRKASIIFFFLVSCVGAQTLSFLGEDIAFYLNGESFTVDGYYWFSNPSGCGTQARVFYPIACQMGPVDSIVVADMSHSRYGDIVDSGSAGFSFRLDVGSGDTVVYHIAYRQRISGDSAAYILRSTLTWNKPLEWAEYKLVVDSSLIVTRCSYDPDKVYTIADRTIYYWKRVQFMPDKDMVFHFRRH